MLFLAVSHNVRFADDSATEGTNSARLWPGASKMAQHGDLSIVFTEHERKDCFEHSKEPNSSFSVGRKRRYKVDLKHFVVVRNCLICGRHDSFAVIFQCFSLTL